MHGIAGNILYIKSQIPSSVRLIAVSKTKPVNDIIEAYNTGQRSFGENRVQELLSKKDLLPDEIDWHLIGHLQTNKVKYIASFIGMVQSVDTYKLLTVLDTEAKKNGRIINCLLQIHIAKEQSKSGFLFEELNRELGVEDFDSLGNLRICGVMGMATFTPDVTRVRKEFGYLRKCFDSLKEKYFSSSIDFKEISMGMSGDYQLAIEEGSTMVRIGSLIFGER